MTEPSYRRIANAVEKLRAAKMQYSTNDAGRTLTVSHNGREVRFWPVGGRFAPIPKPKQRWTDVGDRRGVDDLIEYLRGQ